MARRPFLSSLRRSSLVLASDSLYSTQAVHARRTYSDASTARCKQAVHACAANVQVRQSPAAGLATHQYAAAAVAPDNHHVESNIQRLSQEQSTTWLRLNTPRACMTTHPARFIGSKGPPG
jgi:hypothetical protein